MKQDSILNTLGTDIHNLLCIGFSDNKTGMTQPLYAAKPPSDMTPRFNQPHKVLLRNPVPVGFTPNGRKRG